MGLKEVPDCCHCPAQKPAMAPLACSTKANLLLGTRGPTSLTRAPTLPNICTLFQQLASSLGPAQAQVSHLLPSAHAVART